MATPDSIAPTPPGQILTYKVRAYPTRQQHARLADYLTHTRQLYNAALEERIDCYRKTRRSSSNAEQARGLSELRRDPAFAAYPRRMQRWAINLVETAYRGMFTRHRKGERGRQIGFPRFRGRVFWNTLGWDSPVDFSMRDRGLHSAKSFGGTLRLRPDRELPPWDRCKAITLCRNDDRWFANLSYEMPTVAVKERAPMRPVGLDLGLITLAMRSDGVAMNAPRQSDEDTAAKRRAGRALARCRKRSKRRYKVRARLRRIEARITRRRTARLHVISARLTHHFDAVAMEDLNIAGMNQGGGGGAAGRGIRKSWRDRAPGALVEMLEWKCRRDGRRLARVDARGTSIDCATCGAAVPKPLRERVHRCECGSVRDRDHNAALNVLARAGWGPLQQPVGQPVAVEHTLEAIVERRGDWQRRRSDQRMREHHHRRAGHRRAAVRRLGEEQLGNVGEITEVARALGSQSFCHRGQTLSHYGGNPRARQRFTRDML